MSDITDVTGMVISSMPVGEADRRIVLLTREHGKISAFVRGARKVNSPFTGITRAFVFGTFQVYQGRSAYSIRQASISEYFEGIINDLDAICYACYFAEIADYFAREELDATALIQLLYVSLKALMNPRIPNSLIRLIYELKAISLNGEGAELFTCRHCGSDQHLDTYSMSDAGLYCRNCHGNVKDGISLTQSTIYTLQYIVSSPIEKLYTFTVSDEVYRELKMVLARICNTTFDRSMKSREFLPET